MNKNNLLILIIALIAVICVASLAMLAKSPDISSPATSQKTGPVSVPTATLSQTGLNGPDLTWLHARITDVNTGGDFTLGDNFGKPVLVLLFTLSCPICVEQQKAIMSLKKEYGNDFIFVGLVADPNEKPENVKNYLKQHNFGDSKYAIMCYDLGQPMVDEYGIGIVTPANAPLIVICNGTKVNRFGWGIKSESMIKEGLFSVC